MMTPSNVLVFAAVAFFARVGSAFETLCAAMVFSKAICASFIWLVLCKDAFLASSNREVGGGEEVILAMTSCPCETSLKIFSTSFVAVYLGGGDCSYDHYTGGMVFLLP